MKNGENSWMIRADGCRHVSWFALASYRTEAGERAAIVKNEQLFDLELACKAGLGNLPSWSQTGLPGVFREWDDAAGALSSVADAASQPIAGALDSLVAPVRTARIFAAASNYVEHADEMGTALAAKAESSPYMFIKASTCVIGPGETVRLPPESNKVDWEVELAVVIGRGGRRIPIDSALEHVAGYTILNDVSARDLTKRNDYPFKFDWFQGKSFDTFAPLGPWVVPGSIIGDPQRLALRLSVNDELMQDAKTSDMIFDVREQIAYLSTLLTLQPGDIISTGTPTGVGMGRGRFLKPGDVMTATIEQIGTLTNPVDAEMPRD